MWLRSRAECSTAAARMIAARNKLPTIRINATKTRSSNRYLASKRTDARPCYGMEAAVATAAAAKDPSEPAANSSHNESPAAGVSLFSEQSMYAAKGLGSAQPQVGNQQQHQQHQQQQQQQPLLSRNLSNAKPSTAGQFSTRPSAVRRCRSTHALCNMLYHHHSSVSPQFWVTALVHLSHLVSKEGQQIPADSWRKVRECLRYLVTEQQQQLLLPLEPLVQAAPETAPPPLAQFNNSDVVTCLWALAKLKAQLPAALEKRFWPVVLQQLSHGSSSSGSGELTPRDMALLAWSLHQLQAPMPAGWFQGLIDAQVHALPGYPTESLVILVHAAARLGLTPSNSSTGSLLAALLPSLRRMSTRDLSQLLWSFGVMRVRPSREFMAVALEASRWQLSGASCREMTALVVGVARLCYLPPGPWLLELYDQLYWTADQLELHQLSSILWAFGKLRLVAVPQELLERLLTFAHVQLQPLLMTAAAAAAADRCGGSSSSSTTASGAAGQLESAVNSGTAKRSSKSSGRDQYVLAKQIYTLMVGLAALRKQLPAQTNIGQAWIAAVLAGKGPLSHVHVPACLYAAALLKVRLPGCPDTVRSQAGSQAVRAQAGSQAVRAQAGSQAARAQAGSQAARAQAGSQAAMALSVLQSHTAAAADQDPSGLCQAVAARLSGLRHRLSLSGLALGFWGAVGLGCRPDKAWVEGWIEESQNLLRLATAGEINMLLQGCTVVQHVPQRRWFEAVHARLDQLLLLSWQEQRQQQSESDSSTGTTTSSSGGCSAMSGSSMVATLKYLLALQKIQKSQRQQQQRCQWLPLPPKVLARMSARMEYLESQRLASPTAVRSFQRYKAHLERGHQQQQ